MKRTKAFRRLLKTLLILFLLLNGVAFLHAYRFTHYDSSARKTKDARRLSLGEKLGIVFTGVKNPRPQNEAVPDGAYETVRLRSNKEIECWHIRVPGSRGTVALFHGYGGEKSTLLDKAAVFQRLGYNTLLVDFMGSGGSEGRQTTIGFKEAEEVKTCFDHLKAGGEERIFLFGTSLGAAAVMKAMRDYQLPVHALILECPFSTMLQTVKNRFGTMGIPSFPMAHLLVFWGGVQNGFNAYRHNPVDYARSITCPVLLLYGAKDEKVTPEETAAIFSRLAGPKSLVTFPLAGHENYLTRYREQWTAAITRFLR
ncbi:MAG TPA: alpha/beta fold hydrolase [Chitinophagaceae bacterium]|nr:alpha/beta fold hydrolase [Chitinophagaceae bacterium]